MWMWGKVRNALNSVASAQQAKLWQAITDWQKATFNLLKCTHSNVEWINSIVESLYVILLGAWLNTSTPHQPSELSVSLNNATTLTSPPKRKPPTDVNTDDLECWWSELKWYTRSFLHEWSLAKEGKGGRVGVEVGGIHYTDRWVDGGCAETLVDTEIQISPPENVAESSWNHKIIVLAQTRSGQTQWLWGSPGFKLWEWSVAGAQISCPVYVRHPQKHTFWGHGVHCKLYPCGLKGFCSRVFCCCFLFSQWIICWLFAFVCWIF